MTSPRTETNEIKECLHKAVDLIKTALDSDTPEPLPSRRRLFLHRTLVHCLEALNDLDRGTEWDWQE